MIGPNGAGKNTLFRMITGDEAPDSGEFDLGETVKLGYVDQSRDALEDKQTVLAGNLGRNGRNWAWQAYNSVSCLRRAVQFQRRRPAKTSWPAIRR